MLNLEYDKLYPLSIKEPEKLWDEYGKNVVWDRPYLSVLKNKDSPFPEWYSGGQINMSYNCLDKQVLDGYGDDVAVIHDSPVTGTTEKWTYNHLLQSVELLAGVMVETCGVKVGDNVLLLFSMIPECLVAILACTRIGAVYSTLYGGLSPKEMAGRIQHFEPKVIILSNVEVNPDEVVDFKQKMDEAIELSEVKPKHCIVYNRRPYRRANMKTGRDMDWNRALANANPHKSIPVKSDHPMYVIYTSGTTGNPKGLVINTAGSIVVNKYSMKYFHNIKVGETFFCLSSFAWVLGQSMMSFGPLMSRNPTILYEDKLVGRKESMEIIRILNQHKVVNLLCTPLAMRIIKQKCAAEDIVITSNNLRAIYLTGEYYDSSFRDWVSNTFRCPVYNSWGQTELAGYGIASCLGFKRVIKPDTDFMNGVLIPGLSGKIVDRDTGIELPHGSTGRFVLKLPLTPATACTIYKNKNDFLNIYFMRFPGYYDTMDSAVFMPDGSLKIVSRDDNIFHVASNRINGFDVEMVCLQNPSIEHVTVVPINDLIKENIPFAFLVKKTTATINDTEIISTTKAMMENSMGEVGKLFKAVLVPELPTTKSGKTLRHSLRDMINGKPFKVPIMTETPGVYKTIYDILIKAGYKPSMPTSC